MSVRVSVTLWPCDNDRNWTVVCLFIKLGRHVDYTERMNPIDFGGQRSKVKVTIDIYGNKLVNTIKTEPLCASSSNFAYIFTMTRGWTLLILEVIGQRSRSQLTYMEKSLWTRYKLNRCVPLHKTWQTCSLWREDEPYWFWRSEVKVTIDIYGNKLVNTIET